MIRGMLLAAIGTLLCAGVAWGLLVLIDAVAKITKMDDVVNTLAAFLLLMTVSAVLGLVVTGSVW